MVPMAAAPPPLPQASLAGWVVIKFHLHHLRHLRPLRHRRQLCHCRLPLARQSTWPAAAFTCRSNWQLMAAPGGRCARCGLRSACGAAARPLRSFGAGRVGPRCRSGCRRPRVCGSRSGRCPGARLCRCLAPFPFVWCSCTPSFLSFSTCVHGFPLLGRRELASLALVALLLGGVRTCACRGVALPLSPLVLLAPSQCPIAALSWEGLMGFSTGRWGFAPLLPCAAAARHLSWLLLVFPDGPLLPIHWLRPWFLRGFPRHPLLPIHWLRPCVPSALGYGFGWL